MTFGGDGKVDCDGDDDGENDDEEESVFAVFLIWRQSTFDDPGLALLWLSRR